jgi:Fungal specific transcription factor domain
MLILFSRNIEKLLDQIQKMQTQIDTLTGTVDSFNAANPTPLSSTRKESSQSAMPLLQSNRSKKPVSASSTTGETISYHGLTTSSFNFGIAQQTLRSRGITEVGRVTSGSSDDEYNGPSSMRSSPSPSPRREGHHRRSSIDPLRGINLDEALRLFHIYEEEMGIMYPILDPGTVINQINMLYTHIKPFSETAQTSSSQEQPLSEEDINILKLVFACAMTAEANGKSELATSIFRGVRDVASDLVWRPPSIKRLIIIALVVSSPSFPSTFCHLLFYSYLSVRHILTKLPQSIYLFQTDEETIAWRIIGTAQRLCLEMGLHRSETYPQHAIVSYGKEGVLKLFWSVYTLDMRFSMGTGMPYHLDTSDIDPSLPRPVSLISHSSLL